MHIHHHHRGDDLPLPGSQRGSMRQASTVDHAAAMPANTCLVFKGHRPVRVLELPESFRNVELVDIWDDHFLGLCIPAVP